MVDEWTGPPRTLTPRRVVIAAVAIGAVSAAVWGALYAWPVHQAKQTVRAQLKDPGSAVFDGVAHFRATGATCGLTNARNSFGGYVGFRPFVLDRYGVLTWGGEGDLADQDLERRLAAVRAAIAFRGLLDLHCPGLQ